MAASLSPDVAFVVDLSGTTVTPNEQLLHKSEQTLKQQGMPAGIAKAQSFSPPTIDRWYLSGCPVTITTLTARPERGAIVGWETKDRTYFANVQDLANPIAVGPPPSKSRQKCPSLTTDKDGNTLATWMEGPGWGMDGVLHWKVFDPTGAPTEQQGKSNESTTRRNAPTAITVSNGRFLILY